MSYGWMIFISLAVLILVPAVLFWANDRIQRSVAEEEEEQRKGAREDRL